MHSHLNLESKTDRTSGHVIDAALKVHSGVGPGLLESAYQACLAFELRARGLHVQTQVPLPVVYRGNVIDLAYRIDMVVENLVIVEVKAIKKLLPVHEAQVISYLRLSGKQVGLLLNFHVPRMREGITRLVNEYSPTS